MDIKGLQKLINEDTYKKVEKLKNDVPPILGQMAVSHFKDNFHKSGYVDGDLHPWKKSKRQESGGKSADSNYSTLTSSHNRLMGRVVYTPGYGKVTVRNSVEYAAIHNEGGTINSTITPKMRKFAWAKYYEALGSKKPEKGMTIPEDAVRWRGLALTKKTKLNITMPKRQFMGAGKELEEKLQERLNKEIEKVFNI